MCMPRLDGKETGVQFFMEARDFSRHQSVETAPGSTGALFPGYKRVVDQLPLSRAEVDYSLS
jgi:hypothetical protein